MDHSEHSVQIVVTEQGVADLRGKDPHERANLLINHCAHPDYRSQLHDYLKLTKAGHEPLSLSLGLAMHRQFLVTAICAASTGKSIGSGSRLAAPGSPLSGRCPLGSHRLCGCGQPVPQSKANKRTRDRPWAG
jgi:hypothetical protein